MTTLGDAIHDNAHSLVTAPVQMIGGYVTGSPDIQWTQADWALFPELVHVTIDQGFTGSPVPTAIVRDVEPGAWSPAAAVDTSNWTAAAKTIYCDRNDLPAVLKAGWRGNLWLAIPGWTVGSPLPSAPGCVVVAVQNRQNVNNQYDLSEVLDNQWPGSGNPPPMGVQKLPTYMSATPYRSVNLGWNPSETVGPNNSEAVYHIQVADAATGNVLNDQRVAGTNANADGLPNIPLQWRLAVGALNGLQASPWSAWLPIAAP